MNIRYMNRPSTFAQRAVFCVLPGISIGRRSDGSRCRMSPPSTLIVLFALLGFLMYGPALVQGQPVEWTQQAVVGAGVRSDHAMAYDSARGVTVLFGGSSGGGAAETWEWNGTVWTQRFVTGPSGRSSHAMVYDSARGVTVLFGGFSGGGTFYADTWEWNGTVWTQRFVTGPSARAAHAIAYDAARGVTVLFGGAPAMGPIDNHETWEWNGTAWTQRMVSGPSGRSYHAMAYDAARHVTVLFGGFVISGGPYSGETWEWNGSVWTQRMATGPAPRLRHDMSYDAIRGVTTLFGGFNPSGRNGETWEWNGTAWTQRFVSGPSPRDGHAMAFDAGRGVTVLYGGSAEGAEVYEDTWLLGAPCTSPFITAQPSPQRACLGGSTIFTLAASGDAPISYQWQRDNVGLIDQPNHISGASTTTLVVINITQGDQGEYRCIISNDCGSESSNTAVLTICLADFNCDSTVNSADFFDFLTAFFTNAPTADFNRDGLINSQDFFDFLAAFFAGC